MSKLQSQSTSNTASMVQRASIAAVSGSQECVGEMRADYIKLRDRILARPEHGQRHIVAGRHPEHSQGADPAAVIIRGGSCIVDPFGKVLVEPSFAGETIGYAELDRNLIARGKYDLDVVGHYARPDVFKLSVDTRVQKAVGFEAPSSQEPE